MELLTGSKKLCHVVSKGTGTSEKNIMSEMACTTDGFLTTKINDIDFICIYDNMAHEITKLMKQNGVLSVISTSRLSYNVEQWPVTKNLNGNWFL